MTTDIKETKLINPPPILVAHRGYSGRYPENTLIAYQAAYQHGARYMELDLQLTADRVPFLHHDVTLERMAGIDLDIRDAESKRVKQLRAAYSVRFDEDFADNRFTTFKKFCKWLKKHPDVTVFVEIKPESLQRFSVPVFVDEVHRRILQTEVADQCVIISFSQAAVEYARKVSTMQVGWAIPKWSEENRKIAEQLKPEYLFCDKNFLPNDDAAVWQGNWQWAIYNLDDVRSAIAMANRGFAMLETNQIGTLMQSADLRGS